MAVPHMHPRSSELASSVVGRLWQRIDSAPGSDPRSRLVGIGLMLFAALSWAGIELLGATIPAGYSPFQTVWVRYGTHLLLMLALLGPSERWRMIRTPRLGLQIVRSLLMLAMPACFVMASQAGLGHRLIWAVAWIAAPLMIILASLFLKEPVPVRRGLACLLGLVGAWLVLSPSRVPLRLSLLLPLGVAGCYALYTVMTRAMRTEATSANLFHTALWVFVPLSLLMPWCWRTPSPSVLLAMAGIGVWGFLVLLALDRALAWAPVAVTAPIILTQPAWTALAGQLLHRSSVGPLAWLGIVTLLGGVGWVAASELRNAPPATRSVAPSGNPGA